MEQRQSRCPDPHPSCLYLWLSVKQTVCRKSIQDLGHFMLTDAVAFITPDTIGRVWQGSEY